jgi:hypothetical protein
MTSRIVSFAERTAPGDAAEAEVDDLAHPRRAGVHVVDRHERLEVRASAGRVARAGEDGDVDGVVVAEVLPDLDQRLVHGGIDRVLGLGAIERDARDPVALLVARAVVAHRAASPSSARAMTSR